MNSTFVNDKNHKKIIKYPCLGIHNDTHDGILIVLFTDKEDGVVVAQTETSWNIGERSTTFIMEEFHIFDGEVTITN